MIFNPLSSFIHFWKIVLTLLLIICTINIVSAAKNDTAQRLKTALLQLGFPNGQLPVLIPALGNYVDVVQVDKLLFLSSAAPQTPAGTFVQGRVPNETNSTQAVIAAQLACVRQVNRLKNYLGDLNRVKKIVYVKGNVLAQSNFTGHTAIVDGCSAFLVYVFGNDIGKHARATNGLASMPFNVTLEIEMIVERK
jgi:enamine deaminase RidA (YjgF/YER057c/UK114 family)